MAIRDFYTIMDFTGLGGFCDCVSGHFLPQGLCKEYVVGYVLLFAPHHFVTCRLGEAVAKWKVRRIIAAAIALWAFIIAIIIGEACVFAGCCLAERTSGPFNSLIFQVAKISIIIGQWMLVQLRDSRGEVNGFDGWVQMLGQSLLMAALESVVHSAIRQ
jgi:hypothetical protein